MHSKNNGKVLRDNKIFFDLQRQGRLKYNVVNIRPLYLKYYKHFVRNKNIHSDELTGIYFVVWDVLAYHHPNHGGYRIERITYAYDSVSPKEHEPTLGERLLANRLRDA